MQFQLIPVTGNLRVEGDSPTIGRFEGHVIAVGLRDYDPLASPERERQPQDANGTEGLWGWGRTHFLVCDPDKGAPVWVSKSDIDSHTFEPAGAAVR